MNIFQSDTPPFTISQPDPRGRKPRYPFRELELHQGFVLSASEAPQFKYLRSFVQQIGRRLGKQFLVHQEEDGSVVVWRQA
jgi:hypothetical protein